MTPIMVIGIALVAIVIAWKVLAGIVKTVALVGILLVAGAFALGVIG